MNWNDAARAAVIALLVMIANGLLFQFNRWLFNTYRIGEAGFEYGYVGVAIVPAAFTGLVLILTGFRSRLWWWLFAPGLLFWVLRPLRGRDGWTLDWAFDELPDYLSWVIFHFERTPDHAFAALNGAVVMVMITAVLIGQSIRFTRKAVRQRFRDGSIGAPGGGSASGRGGTAQLPQARWASRSEVRARFSHPGGIVLGEMTDPLRETPKFTPGMKRRWRNRQGRGELITMNPAEGNGHVLVMSKAGDFKTTGIVTSNILQYDDPLIVFDPKCELYARTRQARIDKGFNPVVIDAANGFDPAKLIALLAEDHPSAWLRMARLMIPDDYAAGVSNGKYFKDAATALFSALLAHYASIGSRNIVGNIAGILSLPPDQVYDTVDAMMSAGADDFVINKLRDVRDMESRFWYSVKTEITNNLLFAEYPDIQRYWSMEPDSPLLAQLVDPKTDIFLNIPQHVAEDFAPMLRLMLGSILVATQLVEVNEAPRARRLILIDEASRLGAMDILENIRDRGRSIGLHLMMIYQDAGQIEKIWGQAGQRSWRNGCSAMIGGPVSDPRSAQDLSTMLGSRMIRVTTEGSSSQTPVMSGALGGSTSSSETEQVRDIPLISPTLISQLPGHAAIIASPGSKPILATKAIWFTRDDMKDRVRNTDEIMQELDVFEGQKKLIERLETVTKKNKDGGNGSTGETDPQSSPVRETKTTAGTAAPQPGANQKPAALGKKAASTAKARQNYETQRYPEAEQEQPKSTQAQETGAKTRANSPPPTPVPAEIAPQNTSHAKPGRTGTEAASAEQPAQKTLPLSQPADAVTTTAPRSRGNSEEKIVPSNALTSSDQSETKESARLTHNGITCDTRDGRRLVPDPGICRDFAEWVLQHKEVKSPAEIQPSGQSISAENVSDGEAADPDRNPSRETGTPGSDPEMTKPGTASSATGSDHAEASTVRSDDSGNLEDQAASSQAQPTQAPATPWSDPAVSGNTEQDGTDGQGGESGDEAGKKESGQDRQARSTTTVQAQKVPQVSGTAQGDQAAPQGSDIPDPSASRRRAQTEEPTPTSGQGLNDGLWREPPAFWGELGIPREMLDFGRKPPRDPATLPRWLRPFWNATTPLRRLWVRIMLPGGDIPLNLRPYTMEIIPRPHDAREGSWLLRKWDILDWYLSHPGDRYNVYDHKLRRRRESILRWRLRAWLRGRAPGKPPWLGDPYP